MTALQDRIVQSRKQLATQLEASRASLSHSSISPLSLLALLKRGRAPLANPLSPSLLGVRRSATGDETTAKLDSLARNYQDTCAALRKGLGGGGKKR